MTITLPREQGKHLLYKLEDGKPIPINVRTGIADNNFTEVLDSAIKEGDNLIIREVSDKEKSGSKLKFRMF